MKKEHRWVNFKKNGPPATDEDVLVYTPRHNIHGCHHFIASYYKPDKTFYEALKDLNLTKHISHWKKLDLPSPRSKE